MEFHNVRENWADEVWTKPKLRPYREIKYEYYTENDVLCNLSKKKRSLCSQSRGGILSLHIETSSYVGREEDSWICPVCDLKEIENEFGFFFSPFYWKISEELFNNAKSGVSLRNTNDSQRLNWLFEKETFRLANYFEKAWDMCQKV